MFVTVLAVVVQCRVIAKRGTAVQFTPGNKYLLMADKSGDVLRYMMELCAWVLVVEYANSSILQCIPLTDTQYLISLIPTVSS